MADQCISHYGLHLHKVSEQVTNKSHIWYYYAAESSTNYRYIRIEKYLTSEQRLPSRVQKKTKQPTTTLKVLNNN